MPNEGKRVIPRMALEGDTLDDGVEIVKFMTPVIERDAEEGAASRRIRFVISTTDRDRDNDVIDPKGWILDNYKKNPVVLWAHDSSKPPVARAVNVQVREGRLVATAEFPDEETYDFGATVYRLYKEGFLNAVSVGFMPRAAEFVDWGDGTSGFRFTEQELWEFSAVPIPSNPNALVVARRKGLDIGPVKAALEKTLDEGVLLPADVQRLVHASYCKLTGRVHPVMQRQLAESNLRRLAEREEKDRKEMHPGDGPNSGEDALERPVEPGEKSTKGLSIPDTLSGDDTSATENSLEAGVLAQAAPGFVTTRGVAARLERSGSAYAEVFPVPEALALRDGWPEIWALGDGAEAFESLVRGDAPSNEARAALEEREKWCAEHLTDPGAVALVGMVQRLAVHPAGLAHMRLALSELKRQVAAEDTPAPGPEDTPAPGPEKEPTRVEVDESALIEAAMAQVVASVVERTIKAMKGQVGG